MEFSRAAEVGKLDPASLEMLVFVTGLLIDTLAIRKKIPSPSLNEPAGAAFAPAPAAAPPARPSAPARPAAAAPPQSTMAIPSAQLRDAMVARPTFSGTVAVPTPAAPPPPSKPSAFATSAVPPIATPRAAAPPPPAAPAAEERASTQFIPPSGISTRAAGPPPTDEAKKHDEARRFARLLVSEIKLYNEAKVEQGRKNKDLYERLKEDIDRSRQMYDERISQDVRKASNYFYDELVRILADGDTAALGL